MVKEPAGGGAEHGSGFGGCLFGAAEAYPHRTIQSWGVPGRLLGGQRFVGTRF